MQAKKTHTGSTTFHSCKHRNTKPKQTRQNTLNKNQPHQTTQNRGDATSNKQHATHQTRQKRNTTAKLLLSHMREAAACFSLLYSLDLETIKPIAQQKMKNYRDIKKMQKKHVLHVTCCMLHHPKTEDDT